MVTENDSFGHLTLSRRANGETVRLVRSPDEQVLLAFDTQIKRLVELHLLRGGQPLEGSSKKLAMSRAAAAAEIRGPSFTRVLEVGEDEGVVYYTSNLNEGEFALDYVTRRGALPPATAFSLLLQLLDDVMLLGDQHRLMPCLMLDRVMVSSLEDTFLQLRLYDYGLDSPESEDTDHGRQVRQVCKLIFLLLTGQAFNGDNPDRYQALTALPMSLRTTLRAALMDPNSAPVSIERLRDEVREAHSSLVSSIQARNFRKQLVMTTALQPRSQLQDLLLEGVPVERVLGSRFTVEDEESVRRYPFSIPCLNAKNDQPITVHLLPPSRIVEKAQYDAVPLQSWRFNPEKHPNILRSLSLWESPEWSFLTEEREPGFSLSRLLTERLALNPAEVLVVLRQVQAGIEQALDCGVQRLDLHPSNLFLRVGKSGPTLAREHERLMQKRLDAWPPFHVKLRAHVTMRHLYEPPLAEPPDAGRFDSEHLASKEDRARAFLALAAYLLTGQRQVGGAPVFSEAVPEPLAAFLRETLEATRAGSLTLPPVDFVTRFEELMSAPVMPDLATRLRGTAVPVEEMESAGSVSDFEDDQDVGGYEEPVSPISRRLHAHEFERIPARGMQKGPVLAAAAVVLGAFLGWLFMPSHNESDIVAEAVATKPEPTAVIKPVSKTETSSKDAKPVVAAAPAGLESAVTVKKMEPVKVEKPAEAIAVVSKPVTPEPVVAPAAAPTPAMPVAMVKPEPVREVEKPVVAAVVADKPQEKALTAAVDAPSPPPALAAKPEPMLPTVQPILPDETAALTVRKAVPEAVVAGSMSSPPKDSAVPAPDAKLPGTPAAKPKVDAPAAPTPDPVIIRKAIMPTQDEISRFKQGLVEPRPQMPAQVTPVENNPTLPKSPLEVLPQQIGSVPVMRMAAPANATKAP